MNTPSSDKKIQQVFTYFAQFLYPPLLEEIHLFYPGSITKQDLEAELALLIRHKRVIADSKNKNRFAKYGDKKILDLFYDKELLSQSKINKVKPYLSLLKTLDIIQFVGISGSVSMSNAVDSDDIDLFIITQKNRLWTGRLYAVMLAALFGIRRKRNMKIAKDTVCLNLFFDEQDLAIPTHKQTPYVAHELLQLKPVINKNYVYERLLQANEWVTRFYPQAGFLIPHSAPHEKSAYGNTFFDMVEKVAGWVQLKRISHHRTTEYITPTQLWFFPDDYEKKLRI